MIKVKDPKRLKAFGFKEADLKNSGYIYHKYNAIDDADILVKENGIIEICSAELYLSHVFDDIFDLQAAGLLERVEEK